MLHHKWEILHVILLRLMVLSLLNLMVVPPKVYFSFHFIRFWREINNFRLCLFYSINFKYVVFLLLLDLHLKNKLLLLMKINLDMSLLLTELVFLALLLMLLVLDMLLMLWHIMIFVVTDLLNRVLWIQILKILFIIRLLLLILWKDVNISKHPFYVLLLQIK